jgi:RNA-directed DNA polymerase
VVLCRTRQEAEQALGRVREILGALRLELHPEKTKLVELGIGKEGFDFLGCHFRVMRSHFTGKRYLYRWPSQKAMKSIRTRIRELTDRRRWAGMKDIRDVIAVLNPVLRGWGNYFRTGTATDHFQRLDRYVTMRLVRLMGAKHGWQRRPFLVPGWNYRRFVEDFGLYKLLGTIRYPGGAHAT